ncbi:MAG: hypothetical protein QOF69_78 [Solirubrobacteraceae bacterium]|jgi:hypothetical protein|nr:hypothetical protein [Solirubrobacteraceae bacterium]
MAADPINGCDLGGTRSLIGGIAGFIKGCVGSGAKNEPVIPPGHYIVKVNGKSVFNFKVPGGRLPACIEGGIKGFLGL